MKLRFWFLLPARIWLALLLAAPLAIICVDSALTRGAYGGVSLPATAENYARFFDPLYAAILWRSLLMAAAATASASCSASLWRCLSHARNAGAACICS